MDIDTHIYYEIEAKKINGLSEPKQLAPLRDLQDLRPATKETQVQCRELRNNSLNLGMTS